MKKQKTKMPTRSVGNKYGGSGEIDTPGAEQRWPSSNSGRWEAYGTESPDASTRSAAVNDLQGNKIADGSATAPPSGSSYKWGFKFKGLTPGTWVFLVVNWTFPDSSTDQKSVHCQVAS
jgi:hypothetical protein